MCREVRGGWRTIFYRNQRFKGYGCPGGGGGGGRCSSDILLLWQIVIVLHAFVDSTTTRYQTPSKILAIKSKVWHIIYSYHAGFRSVLSLQYDSKSLPPCKYALQLVPFTYLYDKVYRPSSKTHGNPGACSWNRCMLIRETRKAPTSD